MICSNIKQVIKKLKRSDDGRTLVTNFSYLVLLQIASYVFPLITLPYLAQVIGVDGFGKIAFANSIIVWFQTIADWGFNYTATRDVAKNRDNPIIVSEIFSSVFWARCILASISFLFLIICICLIPILHENANIILATFLLIPGYIMFPTWFFQAMERMKYITYLNLLFKIIFTIAIFIFIKKESDYILHPLITSLGYAVCGIVTMLILIKKWRLKLHYVSLKTVYTTIKSSTNLFLNDVFPNFYKAFSGILLGFVGGTSANGILEAGTKFEDVVYRFIHIISRTFFPFLSRKLDKHSFFAKINIGISIFSAILLFIGAPWIIKTFYSTEFLEAIPVLRIMSLSIIFLALSNTYGVNYLVISGHEKKLRNITMASSIIGFAMSLPLVYYYSYIGAAITITVSRFFLGIGSMIVAKNTQSGV